MSSATRRFAALPSTLYLLKSAESVIRARSEAVLRGSAVTNLQYVALGVLQTHSRLTGAALARLSFVTPQSMQDMIRALESKGLIHRERSPENRREMLISITSAGETLMNDLEPKMAELDDALVSGFTGEEVALFRQLLKRAKQQATQFESDNSGGVPNATH